MTNDLRLIDFPNLTPEQIAGACHAAMDACDAAVATIVAVPDAQRTFANTLLALEDASDALSQASGQYAFMGYVSADETVRGTGREWDEKLDKYAVALSFREDLYEAVAAFAEMPEAAALAGEEKRLLEHELRDYRRNGFALPAERRAQVKEAFDELVAIDTKFRNAIDDWEGSIVVNREDLIGMPQSWIEGLKTTNEDGETKYRVSLDYPELFPFLSNAEREDLRRELFIKNEHKGGDENTRRLEEALRLRANAAQLLGYDSWAAYKTETRMAKSRVVVDAFLADLREKVALKAAADLRELEDARAEDADERMVNIWDWRFYHNRLMKTKYAVDEFEVAKYFPMEAVLEGLFSVTQKMMAVRYTEAPDAPRWHPDVKAYDISEASGGGPFARFYMDLFPRPNKYGHAAAFTLRQGRRLADGSYQKPVSAIVANFTKPTGSSPSLLRHTEVVTFFHEFGHILHQTLTKAERARFSGTATERDFVEAPSQMLEHWCWEPEVLGTFARHYETGAALPAELLASMIAAKNLSSGLATSRQLYFATLDMAYHSPGFDGDSTAKVRELHGIMGFQYTPGTHFQSGFGHLFGYDAGYYGYLWSHVFGDDMYTRFEQAGPLDLDTGSHYRRTILERGGAVDGDQLVRDFLGREPNNAAFLRGLGLEV